MKIFSSRKRVAAIGVITAATLVGGGMAVAYWTAGGTGTGDATTAAGLDNLLIEGDAATAMYPGDSVQDLDVTVTNLAANKAYVTSLAAYITTDKVGCTGADYLINGSADGTEAVPTPLVWTATELSQAGEAGDSAVSANTIQFNNMTGADAVNQDACKGAAVTINYIAS